MATHGRMRVTRHPVTLTGELLASDGQPRSVKVENFSLQGCCVRSTLPVGEWVSISLPRMGCFEAEVRWGRSGRTGLRFRRAR